MKFQAGERVFISGQIGLIPNELVIPSPRSFSTEFALASQHVARVTNALQENSGGGWVGHSQLTIYWLVDSDDLIRSKTGHLALQVLFPSRFSYIRFIENPFFQ